MRKVLVVAAVSIFVAYCASTAYAVGVGFPLDTQDGDQHFYFAVEDSYIFDKDLKGTGAISGTNTIDSPTIDSSNALYTKIGYSFSDYLGIYGKLGMQNLDAKLDVLSGTNKAQYKLEYDFGVVWGIGACTMYKIPGTWIKIGGDVQYMQAPQLELDAVKIGGTEITNQNSSTDAEFSEFSLTFLVGLDIPLDNEVVTSLSPYVGVRYSDADFDLGTITHDPVTVGSTNFTGLSGSLDPDHNVGVILGCDMALWKTFSVGVEGRFVDETAMNVNGSYKF